MKQFGCTGYYSSFLSFTNFSMEICFPPPPMFTCTETTLRVFKGIYIVFVLFAISIIENVLQSNNTCQYQCYPLWLKNCRVHISECRNAMCSSNCTIQCHDITILYGTFHRNYYISRGQGIFFKHLGTR